MACLSFQMCLHPAVAISDCFLVMRNETPGYHSLENLSCLSVTTGKAGVAERVVETFLVV